MGGGGLARNLTFYFSWKVHLNFYYKTKILLSGNLAGGGKVPVHDTSPPDVLCEDRISDIFTLYMSAFLGSCEHRASFRKKWLGFTAAKQD